MRQKSFRFIKFSSSWDNAWFRTSAVVVLQVFVRCQDYLAIERFSTILKQQQQHWKIDMKLCGLQNNWTSYQERKDWRIYHRFQNSYESWIRRWLSIEKPQLFCLVRSCHNINCSNVFANTDIPLPLKFVYQHLPDSRLVALTPLNHMQPLFSRWYNPDEMFILLWVPRPFQLNSCNQESRPDDGEQEASWVCEWWCHRPYCYQYILRLIKDWKCLAKHKYCQKS
jgi:hypothetical protein